MTTEDIKETFDYMKRTGRGVMAPVKRQAYKDYKPLFDRELIYYCGWDKAIKLTNKGEQETF